MNDRAPVPSSWVTPQIRSQLRQDPWFAGLPPELEAELLSLATPRRLQAGQPLFFRGDAPDGLYAVLEGALRISGVTEAGKEAILAILEPPHWFGEIALFDRLPRTHNCVAEGATRLLHVPLRELQELLARAPHHWRDFGVLMALKVRLTFIGMEDLALLPAEARLARRLLLLASAPAAVGEDGRCVLPISQTQLGLMLSLSRQTTNQVLQALQEQGLVQVSYGRIEVLDRNRLVDAAGLSVVERRMIGRLHGDPDA